MWAVSGPLLHRSNLSKRIWSRWEGCHISLQISSAPVEHGFYCRGLEMHRACIEINHSDHFRSFLLHHVNRPSVAPRRLERFLLSEICAVDSTPLRLCMLTTLFDPNHSMDIMHLVSAGPGLYIAIMSRIWQFKLTGNTLKFALATTPWALTVNIQDPCFLPEYKTTYRNEL